jgi:hypothetical protein
MAITEHELLMFQRVERLLDHVNGGMTVKSTSPLAGALGQLGCFSYTNIPCELYNLESAISIAGKPAGTLEKPDVSLILQESTASSFGRGETTVLDPTYRNGKEIPAENIAIANRYFPEVAEDEISATMFLGKSVKVKLYKLAVYEEGGHFDWHMDSTHSDQHHATVLLALNTSWEGGDFKLRRNGVETLVDMHPKVDKEENINFQACAFYTDTEHKVEPVKKGIRIVLQYDVEVVGWGANFEDGDAEDEEPDDIDDFFDEIESISVKRRRYQKSLGALVANDELVTKVVDIIKGLLADDGTEEVAFAMQHLYRKNSILPEFLKGADAPLHRALVSASFDVTLRPVVLHTTTDWDGSSGPYMAVRWNDKKKKSSNPNRESGSSDDGSNADSESEDDEDRGGAQAEVFHLPKFSAIKQISCKEYIEHTGNEAQPGERKYFGGGMFVRQKKKKQENS